MEEGFLEMDDGFPAMDYNRDLGDLFPPDDSAEVPITAQSQNVAGGLRLFFRRATLMFQILLVIITTTVPFAMAITKVRRFLTAKSTSAPLDVAKNLGMNDAKIQVARITSTLEKTKTILASAKLDRASLADDLKRMGIRSASDIKANSLARRIAEDIGRISNEIDSYEQKIASVSTQLLQAKAIVRRIEMEQSGLTEEELKDLSRQLHEADTNSDGWTQSISPMELEQAVNKALKQ